MLATIQLFSQRVGRVFPSGGGIFDEIGFPFSYFPSEWEAEEETP